MKKHLSIISASCILATGGPALAEVGMLLDAKNQVFGGTGWLSDERVEKNNVVSVVLWNTKTKSLLGRYGKTLSELTCASISPGGDLLAIGGKELRNSPPQTTSTRTSPAAAFRGGFMEAFRPQTPVAILIDTRTGNEVVKLDCKGNEVKDLKFAPDGKSLAGACADLKVRLWEVPSGKIVKELSGGSHELSCIAFSSDGKTLFARDSQPNESEIKKWSIDSGNSLGSYKVETTSSLLTPTAGLKLSRDGRFIAIGNGFSHLLILDASTGGTLKSLSGVGIFAISGDGETLATANEQGQIQLRNLKTSKIIRTLVGHSNVPSHRIDWLEFGDNGDLLFSGNSNGVFKVWNCATGDSIATFYSSPSKINDVAFGADSKELLIGTHRGELRTIDTATGKFLRQIQTPESCDDVRILPSKDILLSRSDKSVSFYSSRDGQLLGKLSGVGECMSLDCSPDGERVAVGLRNGKVLLCDTKGKVLSELIPSSQGDESTGNSSPGSPAASGNARQSNTPIQSRSAWRTRPVSCLKFSPDGKVLAVGSQDFIVRLWSMDSGKQIRTLLGHDHNINDIAFADGGRQLLSVDTEGRIKLWNSQTGNHMRTIQSPERNACAIAVSHDGTKLASSSLNLQKPNFIRVWDMKTFALIRTIPLDLDRADGLVFSPDDQWMAAGSTYGNIRLWNCNSGAKRVIDNSMSKSEH